MGSFIIGTLIHLPYSFTSEIKAKQCLFDGICFYEAVIHKGLSESIIWKTYIVLCQLLIRFIPAVLLIILNILIIKAFNLSLDRKKKLLSGRKISSIKRSASKLLKKPSQIFSKTDTK